MVTMVRDTLCSTGGYRLGPRGVSEVAETKHNFVVVFVLSSKT